MLGTELLFAALCAVDVNEADEDEAVDVFGERLKDVSSAAASGSTLTAFGSSVISASLDETDSIDDFRLTDDSEAEQHADDDEAESKRSRSSSLLLPP